jgi:heme exporter protein B
MLSKDVRRELRARAALPAMMLLAFVLVLTLELQADLAPEIKRQLVGGLLWLAVFFAGTLGLERSIADENEAGCWDALRTYPVSAAAVYTAKLLFNFLTLLGVAALLIPLLAILTGEPLLHRPAMILLVAVLANFGLAAIGTLLAAIVNGLRRRANMIALLLLPLLLPILLGAGEATRLVILDDFGKEFWRWVQLLAAFAAIFFTTGLLAFEFVMED